MKDILSTKTNYQFLNQINNTTRSIIHKKQEMNTFQSDCQEKYEHLCKPEYKTQPEQLKIEFSGENNVDYSTKRMSICFNCNKEIVDPYILRVDPDLEFHANCLSCSNCSCLLDENCKVFVRSGKTYCKNDYLKVFAKQCTRCRIHLEPTNMVMRAGEMIYHMNCFNIQSGFNTDPNVHMGSPNQMLHRQMYPNGSPHNSCDEFLGFPMGYNNNIFPPGFNPQMHHGSEYPQFPSGGMDGTLSTSSGANSPYSNPDSIAAPSSINSGCGGGNGNAGLNNGGSSSGTSSSTNGSVLNESQLKILKQMYGINQRPDTVTKEDLVEKTGLSARVIRVWFQNKRCKDKKRQNALKEQQQHLEKEQALHGVRLGGVGPLIASSPSSIQDSICGSLNSNSGSMNPIDIRQFPQNPALWSDSSMDNQHSGNQNAAPASSSATGTNLYLQQTPLMMQSILSNNQMLVPDITSCQSQQQSFVAAMNYGNPNGTMSAILAGQTLNFSPHSGPEI